MSDDFSWSFFCLHQELQPTYLDIFIPGLYMYFGSIISHLLKWPKWSSKCWYQSGGISSCFNDCWNTHSWRNRQSCTRRARHQVRALELALPLQAPRYLLPCWLLWTASWCMPCAPGWHRPVWAVLSAHPQIYSVCAKSLSSVRSDSFRSHRL